MTKTMIMMMVLGFVGCGDTIVENHICENLTDGGVPNDAGELALLGDVCSNEVSEGAATGPWFENDTPRPCEAGTICAAASCVSENPSQCGLHPEGVLGQMKVVFRCLSPCRIDGLCDSPTELCMPRTLSFVASAPVAPASIAVCVETI